MQTLISTAVGTLARQGRFRADLFLGVLFVVFGYVGCTQSTSFTDALWLESTNESLHLVNGLVHHADQPYTGTVLTFYPATRDTAEVARYRAGREDGTWRKYYYETGKLMEERSYTQGKKTGEYRAWWPNGKKKLHYRFADDEYDGICREWNESGRLVQEMNYVKGHEEGSQKMYYDNGKIRSNYTVIAGRRYGLLGTKKCVNVKDSVFVD
jgi:antitoxin component YwqK of YwqJK toxin-antitoxin module